MIIAIHDNDVLSLDHESAPEGISGPSKPFQSARWLGFGKASFLCLGPSYLQETSDAPKFALGKS
jgi:hypothetical protein